jgi:NTP pyrophosphatase (non-canonical NTP hydrolase)
MEIRDFQQLMLEQYGTKDATRGVSATIAWLTEEMGELAQAVRKGTLEQQAHELADVFAWLVSLANQLGLDLESAATRFAGGCPSCSSTPCVC